MPAELLAGTPPPSHPYDADIIILSHHRLTETLAAIRSAASQTGCNHHIIVLDQNSPPATRNALIPAISTLPNAALFATPDNLGVPGGRNLASSLGHGTIIAALDNDACFTQPDIVAQATRRLTQTPNLAVIGFRILASDGTSLDRTSWAYPKSLLPRAAGHFASTIFVGCGHAISRSAFKSLGGYDETLFFAWEEYEFARRAIAAGWRIEHHGDLTVTHAVCPEARLTWNGTRWRYFVRNRLLIAHDWHGPLGMIPRAALYLARGLRTGRTRATLAALLEASRLTKTRTRHQTPPTARTYIRHHELRHRLGL